MTLNASNISVYIGKKTLVDSVSLDVSAGEILAIVGPNGAGKSTLLKALTGEMPTSEGTISFGAKQLSQWNKNELARIRAVLPQSSTLSFGFSAQEVVLMGRTPHIKGRETQHDYDIVFEAMKLTGTEYLAERTYTTLSGGERQRVQLARVLAQIWESRETRYLLLDEPTNNLDLSYQHNTLLIAKQFAERGVAVITVLHDLNLAAQYADRILILKTGRLLAEGVPHKVLTPEIIQETFNLPVMVQPHPCYNCPLVIPMPQTPDTLLTNQSNLYKEKIS